ILRGKGHEVLPASRSTGVNTLTGEGLAAAFAGAAVVVDVANSPTFEDQPSMDFFQTAGRNIFAAEAPAGVAYHVALSVVGTERLLAMGYFRAKLAQENLIKASGIPYTIVRATQFFEFVGGIADSGTKGDAVRLPHALMQPIAADDVAAIAAEITVGKPLNTTVDIAGPEPICMDDLARQYLTAHGDPRKVVTDPSTGYFGIPVNDESLVPIGTNPRLGPTRFGEWLARDNPA
ncbi:MAG TPA: SDR family oxidoreductase, partial [Lacipirellulaceae bacterium]|nr:SDR family oxidoreductase [Lacipirellulaceae bacterium]